MLSNLAVNFCEVMALDKWGICFLTVPYLFSDIGTNHVDIEAALTPGFHS